MPECNTLYNHKKGFVNLQNQIHPILAATDKKKIKDLVTKFKGNLQSIYPDTVRLVSGEEDTSKDAAVSYKILENDLDAILNNYVHVEASGDGKKQVQARKNMALIKRVLSMQDNTQVVVGEGVTDPENKTKQEVADQNRDDLEDHLKDLYGGSSSGVRTYLAQSFEDSIITVAYWDVSSGKVVQPTNVNLNANIAALKQRQFGVLVTYLKNHAVPGSEELEESMYLPDGEFDSDNYYAAIDLFYSTFADSREDFHRDTGIAYRAQLRGESRQAKTDVYKALVKELMDNDPMFVHRMGIRYTGGKKELALKQLFTADHYSEYYAYVKEYITKAGCTNDVNAQQSAYVSENQNRLLEVLDSIETPDAGILEAANAYTLLTHFDELLVSRFGDHIEIMKGTKNYEGAFSDKYSYAQDTSHQNKNFQDSEDISTEKHTSLFTQAVIRSVRLYDYKTGKFMNRRLNSTMLVVAAHKLLDAIITGKVTFISPNSGVREAVSALKMNALTLHEDPVGKLQKILELLFTQPSRSKRMLIDEIPDRVYFDNFSLSVLKSLYDCVFDKNNPTTLYSQYLQNRTTVSTAVQDIIQELAGFVDRNVDIQYLETSVDFETGAVEIYAKKKFFNNKDMYVTQSRINENINTNSYDDRVTLQNKYKYRVDTVEGKRTENLVNNSYTVTIGADENGEGGFTLSVVIPTYYDPQIMGTGRSSEPGSKGPSISVVSSDTGLLKRLAEVDILNLKEHLRNGEPLSADEQSLCNIIKFLDDTLGMNILDGGLGLETLYSYKSIYNPIENMDNFLAPLVKLGMRAMYVNSQYIKAEDAGGSLRTYLEESNDKTYSYYRGTPGSKIFSELFNDLNFTVASYADEALSTWVDAASILKGEASKATTKDNAGNSIPNSSIGKLGSYAHYYLWREHGTNMGGLLFVGNRSMIKNTYHDLEVTTMFGDNKAIKAFSKPELFQHAIINKFYGTWNQTKDRNGNGTVIVQPTVYSDKSTFLNWEISTSLPSGLNLMTASVERLVEVYQSTLGPVFNAVYRTSRLKMFDIAKKWLADHQEYFASKYGITALDEFSEANDADFLTVLYDMTEKDLTTTAQSMADRKGEPYKVAVERDYRIVTDADGKEHVVFNEMMRRNAELYNNKRMLAAELKKQEVCFLDVLMDNYVTFQVLEGNDTVDMYTSPTISSKARSKNSILKTILEYFTDTNGGVEGRIDYMKTWVDSDSGKLILAKQTMADGTVQNIISVSDEYDNKRSVTLNPLLEKFFYVEGLMSNNLRASLTGLEHNHPVKGKTPFSVVKKSVFNRDAWNDLGYAPLNNNDEFNALMELLKECPDPAMLYAKTKAYTGPKDIYNPETGEIIRQFSEDDRARIAVAVQNAVNSMLDAHYLFVTNNTQSTQFKRNNIIPATLQYCTQNTKNGVARQIKWAVVRDMEAPVYNYRGDEDSIVAHDGSGFTNPFERYLEDSSLGSQAVGDTRKFICHDIDETGADAMQVKFASYAITNANMCSTISSTMSLFKMFKKMNNEQWTPQDNIDLTKSITEAQSFDGETQIGKSALRMWFESVILEGKKLYYKDRHGDIVEITGFTKSAVDETDGFFCYMTREKGPGDVKGQLKYHLFYDTDTQGIDGKSIHAVFNSLNEVKAFRDSHVGQNVHTINSLYELHTALGGIHCCNADGSSSEFSNKVVVNFINNVGYAVGKVDSNTPVNQTNYRQPLKDKMIAYVVNLSAVKNGAQNLNAASSWTDGSELTWFHVHTDGLGVQLNAEHDIINSELTEFSQVIAATAAYGWTYDQANELYKGLARAAVEGSRNLLSAADKFLEGTDATSKASAMSDLYEAVAQIIYNNRMALDKENLTSALMDKVQRVIHKYRDHSNDEFKAAWSDPNLYQTFCATLATTITKRSIKRKHPGSGMVQAPAYGMVQYFEVPDANGRVEKLFAPQILEKARKAYRSSLINYMLGPRPEGEDELKNWREQADSLMLLSLKQLEQLAIQSRDEAIKTQQKLVAKDPESPIKDMVIEDLPEYYIESDDLDEVDQHLMRVWLNAQQGRIERTEGSPFVFQDKSWFMPSDRVEVRNAAGEVIDEIELNTLTKYYAFQAQDYGEGVTFRSSIVKPHDLRPATLRWKVLNPDGTERYMNFFDLPVLRNAFINKTMHTAEYRKAVQDAAHLLHEGKYLDEEGEVRNIIPGSLENEDAEFVTGNMYEDVFGIRRGDALSDVLAKGERYFKELEVENFKAPVNEVYDIAFLRDDGKHTLITTGAVLADGSKVTKMKFPQNVHTTDEGNIMFMREGKDLFEIARWKETNEVIWDSDKKKFVSADSKSPKSIDQTVYSLDKNTGHVLKRMDIVERYKVKTKLKLRNGRSVYADNTLYKIADVETLKSIYGEDVNAYALQGEIIRKLWTTGNYRIAELNSNKLWTRGKFNAISNALNTEKGLIKEPTLDSDVRRILRGQLLDMTIIDPQRAATVIGTSEEINAANEAAVMYRIGVLEANRTLLNDLREEYTDKIAHRKWVSFQDAQKFVSSRIPAQTLQSFLSLKLVGWNLGSSNIAYISHFQTYLQGSDYDIDKANVMGQSYDSMGRYISWSPLFDYKSLATLEASKRLPVPTGLQIENTSTAEGEANRTGANLTELINTLNANADWDPEQQRWTTFSRNEEATVLFMDTMAEALRQLERNDGKFFFDGDQKSAALTRFMATVKAHEEYEVPVSLAEAAFKNSASANIYAVAHDIRNRDQAYTAVTIADLRATSQTTPKGKQEFALNMLNPLTKYVMQYANMTGKNVVGITANGVKFWFAASFYATKVLLSGDQEKINHLKFQRTLTRVKGRAKGTKFDPELATRTVVNLPDLNYRNALLKSELDKLRNSVADAYDLDDDSEELKYIDQKLSQLLSAATDNAKELVLDKLNVDSNFAKVFIYLIILGYDVNDVAAFMTSPAGELIILNAQQNIFQTGSVSMYASTGIDLSEGKIRSSTFLRGKYTYEEEGEFADETRTVSVSKRTYVASLLKRRISSIKGLEARVAAELDDVTLDGNGHLPYLDLDTMMQGLLLALTRNSVIEEGTDKSDIIDIIGKITYKNLAPDMKNYLRYCQDQLVKMRKTKNAYNIQQDSMDAFRADISEFRELYYLADEMSTITTGLLSGNQGIPSDKVGQIKRLHTITRIFTDRERILKIKKNELFDKNANDLNEPDVDSDLDEEVEVIQDGAVGNSDMVQEYINKKREETAKKKNMTDVEKENAREEAWRRVEAAIIENNPLVADLPIRDIITEANELGIVNGFDPFRMMCEPHYREVASNYLNLIKGTINAIDMIYEIPHYREIMELIKADLIADRTLSAKSRLINKVTAGSKSLNDKQIDGIMFYADKLSVRHFLNKTDKSFINLEYSAINRSVDGFNQMFDNSRVGSFDLRTDSGSAGFLRFMVTDFWNWLKTEHADNLFVKHMQKVKSGGKIVLSVDVDLMSPDTTGESKAAYDEILAGLADLTKVEFVNIVDADGKIKSTLHVSDMLELYNLVAFANRYGSERLTTLFKDIVEEEDLLTEYLRDVGDSDYDYTYIPEFNITDYLIASAPIISQASERFHNEPFVKVKDPVWDYVIKEYDYGSNSYKQYYILPALKDGVATDDVISQRRTNFAKWCPYEMPNYSSSRKISEVLSFTGEVTPDIKNAVRALLNDLFVSDKLKVVLENC